MNFIRNLFKFTARDPRFIAHLLALEEKREQQDKRVADLTKAALDHEGDWFLEISKKNPDCALRVMNECRDEK